MQLFNPNTTLKPLPAAGFQKPGLEEQEAQLKTQVDEFAGLIFSQLVREMRESGQGEEEEGGMFGGGNSNQFMHLFDQEVGKTMVEQDGGGLKQALHQQLSTRLRAQLEAKGDSQ